MPVEFPGVAATNDGSETTPRSGAAFDKEHTLRLARAHGDHGRERVLSAYGSESPCPAPAAGPPTELTVVHVKVADSRVEPLLRELGDEYTARYGRDAHAELARYPDDEFTEPRGGVLLLLLERGEPVAGGAFRRYDATTAIGIPEPPSRRC